MGSMSRTVRWVGLGLLAMLLISLTGNCHEANAAPQITITKISPYGDSNGNLWGTVSGVTPRDCRVVTLIEVNGGWWSKPYWDKLLTMISTSGGWKTDITTGINDKYATKARAYLVPKDYIPPPSKGEQTVPPELAANALAMAEITRAIPDPPTVTITKPTSGSIFTEKTRISFAGSALAYNGTKIPNKSLVWTSSQSGKIGTGASFSTTNLAAGNHTITLTATDNLNATSSASITITIVGESKNLDLQVTSTGSAAGNPKTNFLINGKTAWSATSRGINFLTIDPATGSVTGTHSFDTYLNDVQAMNDFIEGLPAGTIVMAGIADEGRRRLNDAAYDALELGLGSLLIRNVNYQDSWAIITAKGRTQSLVEDSGPTSKTASQSIILPFSLAKNPPRAFLAAPLVEVSGEAPLTVHFTDHSNKGGGTISARLWDFGDGTTSSESNPVHTYNNPGVYTIKLTVTTEFGAHTEVATDFVVAVSHVAYKLKGLDVGFYIGDQDPNTGITLSRRQILARMVMVKPYTESLTIYDIRNGLEKTVTLSSEEHQGPTLANARYLQSTVNAAKELGLKIALSVWLGPDLSANEEGIQALIDLLSKVRTEGNLNIIKAVVVGVECLRRKDLTEDQVLGYLARVKAANPDLHVTYCDVYGTLMDHPKIISACDVVYANFYPYWESIAIDKAIADLHLKYLALKAMAGSKPVVVSETGWPSGGNKNGSAVPSPENAAFYFLNFISYGRHYGYEYSYFEAFDENWKAKKEGLQGKTWGVFNNEGRMKPGMQDVFDGKTIPIPIPPEPGIKIDGVSPLGTEDGWVWGSVTGVNPNEYAVAVYILVGNGWWNKPFWKPAKTPIKSDMTWICDITTDGGQGNDKNATKVAVYLIPVNYDPPEMHGGPSLPSELDQYPHVIVTR